MVWERGKRSPLINGPHLVVPLRKKRTPTFKTTIGEYTSPMDRMEDDFPFRLGDFCVLEMLIFRGVAI